MEMPGISWASCIAPPPGHANSSSHATQIQQRLKWLSQQSRYSLGEELLEAILSSAAGDLMVLCLQVSGAGDRCEDEIVIVDS